MKRLQELIDFLGLDAETSYEKGLELNDLYINSSDIRLSSVFIALQGHSAHGLDYLPQAISQGAACVISDRALEGGVCAQVPVFFVEDLKERLPELANWFYHRPSQQLKVIGITGTNGKTSTAHYLAQMLSEKYSVAVLGTLGNGLVGQLTSSVNTTLETVSLNRKLHEFVQIGVDYVVMEVSSHAIALGRIKHIRFEAVALTQVTRDHLDFHKTQEAYREAKAKLFLDYPAKFRVLNLADSLGKALTETLMQSVGECICGYSLKNEDCDQLVRHIRMDNSSQFKCLTRQALRFSAEGFSGAWQWLDQRQNESVRIDYHAHLMGRFNVENLMCAVALALNCGLDVQEVSARIEQIKPVKGRMEKLAHSPNIMIDYAHTPDALSSVLEAIKQHFSAVNSKLWVVFGCGGERDTGKRPLMGKIAEREADYVVVTDDNPRGESPEQIADDILKGMSLPKQAKVIHERAAAIEYAIRQADAEDVILIAGKGHENYQEINGQRFFMSDTVLVDLTLREVQEQQKERQ